MVPVIQVKLQHHNTVPGAEFTRFAEGDESISWDAVGGLCDSGTATKVVVLPERVLFKMAFLLAASALFNAAVFSGGCSLLAAVGPPFGTVFLAAEAPAPQGTVNPKSCRDSFMLPTDSKLVDRSATVVGIVSDTLDMDLAFPAFLAAF